MLKAILLNIRCLSLLVACFTGVCGHALSVTKILDSECRSVEGLIVSVDQNRVGILSLEGSYQSVPIDEISVLAIYDLYENPISKLKPSPSLNALLRDFHPEGEKTIRGWPIRYIQNLVFIYDINGNSHVLDLYDIKKIRNPKEQLGAARRLQAKPQVLSSTDLGFKCSTKKTVRKRPGVDVVIPTRIMADQVQISDFLSNHLKGFRKLSSYEERTYLYPKPFIFEEETTMGILVPNSNAPNDIGLIPLQFKWSNGRPYRFQSRTILGGAFVQDAATLDPLNIIQSDVKSHAFHATFVGNMSALPAGTEFYSGVRDTEGLDGDENLDDVSVVTAFNYTALMGGDFKNLSLSAGFSYPIFRVQGEGEFREILGSELSPVFRFRYFANSWTFRILGSFSDISESSTVSDKQISLGTDSSVDGVINSFSLNAQWIRTGLDFQWNDEIQFGGELLILNGSYEERTAFGDDNFIDFQNANFRVWIEQRFGDYVRIKGFYTHYNQVRDFSLANEVGDETESFGGLGGQFEIIF